MPNPYDRVYVSAPAINCDIVVYGFKFGEDPSELFNALRAKYPLLEGSALAVREPGDVGGGSGIPVVVKSFKKEFV